MSGHLVLVVGPSGAGKDSILRGAAEALKHQSQFVFPRRVITRPAEVAAEDHDTLSEKSFETLREGGGFLLWWQAHGNSYGIPAEVDNQLKAGRVVIINVSRQIIAAAAIQFPKLSVVEITADPAARISRIAERGREPAEAATMRALREVSAYPPSLKVQHIENNGALVAAVGAFLEYLREL